MTCALLITVIIFVNVFCETLIYYVIGVPPQSHWIFAWQRRHMFPGFIAAMLLPAMLMPKVASSNVETPRIATAIDYTAITFLLALLFFRDIEMSFDVLVRYW